MERLSGDGGLHLFVEFGPDFRTRELLEACSTQGVVFTPGDIFYTDGGGQHTMRLDSPASPTRTSRRDSDHRRDGEEAGVM